MDLGISGKKAAVAAASKGLGFAAAKALADEGVQVAICSRSDAAVREAATRIGGGTIPIVADLSTPEGAAGFVRQAIEALGQVDILVPNAGGPPPGTFASTSIEAYREAIDLNLLSTIAMCREAVPAMQERGWGRVVAITSSGARAPIAFLAASSTARAGVTGFLKLLAGEVAPLGVTVCSAQPGIHATERVTGLGRNVDDLAQSIPVRRVGDPDDFGKAVAFLCSEPARFITGTGLLIDGGSFPGLV